MRILYLHQYYCPPGGWGNNRSYDFAKCWAAAGHHVTVLTSAANFPADHAAHQRKHSSWLIDGVQVEVVNVPYSHMMGYWSRSYAFLQFMWQAWRRLRHLPRPDVVYAVSTPPTVGELGRRVAAQHNIPFYFEPGDLWPDVPVGMGILRSKWLVRLLQHRAMRIYNAAKNIFALSEGIRDQLLAHGVAANKIIVSPNGSNLNDILPATKLPTNPVRLLYAGTQGPANDVAALLHALHYLQEHHPQLDYQCAIYGWGKQHDQLMTLQKQHGLGRVVLHAPVPKMRMPDVLQAAHIGIVTFAAYPVLEANSANKYYDYLAAGLPVVINYQGWQAQHLADYRCGLSSPQGNVQAFAENLRTLITDASLRAEMGMNARKLAEARYDRTVLAQQTLEYISNS